MEFQTAHTIQSDAAGPRIKQELINLMDEQINALESATFVGMSAEESRRFDELCWKVAALVDEMMLLQRPPRNAPRSSASMV